MRIFLPLISKITLFFVIFSLCSLFYSLPALAGDAKVEEKKAELADVKQKIASLQQAMKQKQSVLQKEDAVLKDVDLRINEINNKLRELDKRKQDVNEELSDLQEKRKETASSLDDEKLILAQQLRSAYISGHEEYVKLIMNQQDPAIVSRMLVYYRYLTESRVRTIAKINQHLELLSTLESAIRGRSVELKNLIVQERDRWQGLNIAYQEQKKAVEMIRGEIESNEKQIQRMHQDEQELLRLLEKLQEILDELLEEEKTVTSFKALRGSLKLPADAKVIVRYGSQRNIGNLRWKGVVLAGQLGSDIHAVYTGRVVYADWMRGFGLLLIIDHGDSYLSLYGQNESLLVEEGDWVETGQSIATMGKSGGNSKPALYFEIRHNGKPQNPLLWTGR